MVLWLLLVVAVDLLRAAAAVDLLRAAAAVDLLRAAAVVDLLRAAAAARFELALADAVLAQGMLLVVREAPKKSSTASFFVR